MVISISFTSLPGLATIIINHFWCASSKFNEHEYMVVSSENCRLLFSLWKHKTIYEEVK